MSLAGKTELLAANKRRFKEVELPGGLTVRIRSLSERERAAFDTSVLAKKGGLDRDKLNDARQRLIVLCAVDGNGNLLFSEADLPAIQDLDAAVTQALYDACVAWNGMNDEDMEALVKNSVAVHVAASPTA